MGYLIQGAVVHTENQQTDWRNTIRLPGLPSSLGFTAMSKAFLLSFQNPRSFEAAPSLLTAVPSRSPDDSCPSLGIFTWLIVFPSSNLTYRFRGLLTSALGLVVLGRGQKGESWLYLEQGVTGVSGGVVDTKGTLLIVVDRERSTGRREII